MSALLLGASVGMAEEDHLTGYWISDVHQVPPPANPYTLSSRFGDQTCDLRKPQFFLVAGEKNHGDDPRGGAAGDFVCYKAKCGGPLPPVTDAASQFGVHRLGTKTTKLICLPVDSAVCGDGQLGPGEACDGSADAACPGYCLPDCTCQQTCGNDTREGTEVCDGADAAACPFDCTPFCECATPCLNGRPTACDAFYSSQVPNACRTCCMAEANCQTACLTAYVQHCGDPALNDQCAAAVNFAGCAAECCP